MADSSRSAGVGQQDNMSRLRSDQTIRYAVAGGLFGFVFPVVATAIKLVEGHLPVSAESVRILQGGDPLLWIIDTAPFFLGLFAGFAGRRQDAAVETNSQLRARQQELIALQSNLEQRVAERTIELEERNTLMRSLAYLTRQISKAPEISEILTEAVELIPPTLGRFRSSVYLVDERRSNAVLRVSSTEAGRETAAVGSVRPLDADDVIGRAVARGQAEIVRSDQLRDNTGNPSVTEMAFPLSARGRVIGVLDLEPSQPRAFRQHELEVLQLLSDHLAAAIDGARLLDESRSALEQLETIVRRQTQAAWKDHFRQENLAFHYSPAGVRPLADAPKLDPTDGLFVPLDLRGWRIGSLALKRRDNAPWSPAEKELVQKVAGQVTLAIDNNRLLNETRQRALLEQTVSEMSARFNESVDVDSLVKTAVRELAALPEVLEASVLLTSGKVDADHTPSNGAARLGYKYNHVRFDAVSTVPEAGARALEQGKSVVADPAPSGADRHSMGAIPIRLRDRTMGVIVVTFEGSIAPTQTLSMIEQSAERLATALENAGLLEESMKRAQQERVISDITSRISSSISMRNVLQTAVEELGRALPGTDVAIRLRQRDRASREETRA